MEIMLEQALGHDAGPCNNKGQIYNNRPQAAMQRLRTVIIKSLQAVYLQFDKISGFK